MRHIATLLLLAALTLSAGAQVKKAKVHVKRPGTLSQLIKPKDKYRITELTLRGTLNNNDIRFLRDMCGKNGWEDSEGRVRKVDLRQVTFAPGGEPFLVSHEPYGTSGPHTVPACMFYCCPVEQVILPACTDTIGAWALACTRLQTLWVPEATIMPENAIANDTLLTELTLPALHGRPDTQGLMRNMHVLRKVTFRDIDYVSGFTFVNMPALEEIVFGGMVGHIDGYCMEDLPQLRTIRFDGTVMNTGGAQFVKDCPKLEHVVFNGTVLNVNYGEAINCPMFKGYVANGCVVESSQPDHITSTRPENYGTPAAWQKPVADFEGWVERHIDEMSFLSQIAEGLMPIVSEALRTVADPALSGRISALQERRNAYKEAYLARRREERGPTGDTHLETLRMARPYVRTGQTTPAFSYMPPSDSLLTRTRLYFNLDSIAGGGDEISRIKNLLYWLHDNVRHDGGSSWPRCRFNAIDLYETCLREGRGLNCRFMAIMLCEMLLAEGIPARYLTCQPQAYDTDHDCHVITVAWSKSLGKWIWVDPTFAAYVTDENGLLLHPGEVRQRLREGLPLVLNEDANWNHEAKQTVEGYLEEYMAKNLYLITANTISQSEPEGEADHKQGVDVSLVPQGMKFEQSPVITSDDEYFWQPPQ